jgi:hypothetical protein
VADVFEFRSVADSEKEKFDPISRGATSISALHRMTHEGFVYHTSGKLTGILDDGVTDILLVVPAYSYPHFQRFRISAGAGDIDMIAYEDTLASADGTPLTVFNTNRNSSNAPNLVVNIAPTVTDVGTAIATTWLVPTVAGVGQQGTAGIVGESDGEEWILQPSTKYLIRITNSSGGTIAMLYEMLWYESDWTKAGK